MKTPRENFIKVALFLAISSLKRGNKKTTILTIFLMSIVVINLIFLPSIISGVGESFIKNSIDYSYGHIYIEPLEGNQYIQNVGGLLKKIESVPGVISATSRYNSGATLKYEKKSIGANINSINPSREMTVTKFHENLISGEFIGKGDTSGIILGKEIAGIKGEGELAESLGGVEVGEKLEARFTNGFSKNYTVKGIYSAGTGGTDWFVFISEKEMEEVINISDQASSILVKIDERGREEYYKQIFLNMGIKEQIKSWNEKAETAIKDIIGSLGFLNIITFIISLTIAIIVLFIVTYIHTINKKRQIGILKAIGITQKTIILSYVFEALFYTAIGIAIGAIVLVFAISYLTANPLPFPTGELRPIIELGTIIQGLIILIAAGIFSGFFPSWRITKKDILEQIWGTQ